MRIAFLVNGLGLGNSTRCHAIIQHLRAAGAQVAVVTSGNGLWYFRKRVPVDALHEVPGLAYRTCGRRLDVGRTLAGAPALVATATRAARVVADLLDEWRPDAVVMDSFYAVSPVLRRGIPLVAINNADLVVQAYRAFRDRPTSIRPHFWAVEWSDHLFHRAVPHLTLSPALQPERSPDHGRVRHIPPIVRAGYGPAPTPARGSLRRVVVMMSGSTISTPVELEGGAFPFRVDVLGRRAPDEPRAPGVVHHGRLADNRALLAAADLVVVNAGFSAVSEAFAMRKPMVVVPVARHAKQWCNARQIVELGVGMMAAEDGLHASIRAAAERFERLRAAYDALPPADHGARTAADAIGEIAERHSARKASVAVPHALGPVAEVTGS